MTVATKTNTVKQEPSSLSSSLNNANNPLIPPANIIYPNFDHFSTLDSLPAFDIVDENSIDRTNSNGTINQNQDDDPLAPLAHDPFLSSTSFGFDNEMDIGGGGFA